MTEIEIFRIAQTRVDPQAVQRWLAHLGADDFRAHLPRADDVPDPALLIALAAKRCYMSFEPGLNPNVSRVRRDYVAYFDNLLRSRHGSVLEHASYTYAIEGVSRVFTGEMNRHRAGWAISEGSMRFIRFDREVPYWLPDSIREVEGDDPELAERKCLTREEFREAFRDTAERYARLLSIWEMDGTDKNFDYRKRVTSCLRRIVPMGVATGGVWTGNTRALRHVIAMRAAPAAEEEIFHVFTRIARDVIVSEPLLFGDFREVDDGSFAPEHWKV